MDRSNPYCSSTPEISISDDRNSPSKAPRLLPWVGLLTALLAVGCGGESEQAGAPQAPPPPSVTVAEPVAKSITEWDEYTGRLAAVSSVEVRARVSGYLQEVHFEEGAMVEKGDLLYVVDPRPYEATLAETRAQLRRAEVRLELARSELDRAQRLFERRAISEEEMDVRTQEEKEAAAGLEATKAAVEAAQLDVGFTRVRAPLSGRISNTRVTPGNLIRGGTADATLLTTLVSMDPIYFYFSADEQSVLRYLRWIAAGTRQSAREHNTSVFLRLADEQDYSRRGLIDFVDNRIDQATSTLQVRAVFDNPGQMLLPGMFGKIRVAGRGPYDGLLIPAEAVGVDQADPFVYVVDENDTARRRVVELGPEAYGLRVVRKGLEAGERVIIEGIQRVRPDSPVTPETTELQLDESRSSGVMPDTLPVAGSSDARVPADESQADGDPADNDQAEDGVDSGPDTKADPGADPA